MSKYFREVADTKEFREGWQAFEANKHREDNPYIMSELYTRWKCGWDTAQTEATAP